MTNPEIDFTHEGYTAWIESLSTRYRESQIKAAVAVNTEMLKFYFGLGRDIVIMGKDQPWGSGFLKRVSVDLKTKMPDAECFSPRNLYYVRDFYELYADAVNLPQLGAKLVGGIEKLPQAGAKLNQEQISPQLGGEIEGRETYRVSEILPKEIASDLPSIADIESAVGGALPTPP